MSGLAWAIVASGARAVAIHGVLDVDAAVVMDRSHWIAASASPPRNDGVRHCGWAVFSTAVASLGVIARLRAVAIHGVGDVDAAVVMDRLHWIAASASPPRNDGLKRDAGDHRRGTPPSFIQTVRFSGAQNQ